MNNYRLIESAKGIKYIICETECVAVSVIGEELDLAHCDGFEESGDDIGDDGGMTCPVHAVLNVIDSAGLNTTANDLRAQLADVRIQVNRYHERCNGLQQTIAQLRKADTVRPEAIEIDSGSVSSVQRDAWDEGFGSGVNEAMNGFISKRNPYGDP